MRELLRGRSASRDSESKDAFGITRSLVNAATTLRSSALLFAIFCVVGIALSATYVLILQKAIAVDPGIFLRAVIPIVLWISAICAIFLLQISSELDDIERLQDRYFSIGLRTLFEFGDPPGEEIAPDIVDRLLSIDPLLRKEVDAGRAKIQYEVDVKAGGLTFPFDAVISGRRRLVLIRSYADQGRKIDEADIAKLSEEIRNIIAVSRPRRADILAVWRNDLTEQAVGFSQNDEKWECPAGCRILRTMIFVSGKGYQIASAPSEAIAKEDSKMGAETPSAIAYAAIQKGRARKRAALSSIAMASILILATLAVVSISINESNLPNGPGGGEKNNTGPGGNPTQRLIDHDPIVIMGNAGINNASGALNGNGTADDPFIIENWSINASSTSGIKIVGTTAYIVIRNILINSTGNLSNGIWIENATNCRMYKISISNSSNFGIYMENSSRISIVDSSIKHGGYAIWMDQSSEISITNSSANTDGPYSIIGYNCTDVSMVNITSGLSFMHYCSGISITDSKIPGMNFDYGTNIIISGSNASGGGNDGISLSYFTNVSILSNIASHNYWNGMSISDCTNVDIRGNNVSSNGRYGIDLAGCENVTIDRNRFASQMSQSTGAGLSMVSCSNATVTDNLFLDNMYSVKIGSPLNTSIYHNAFVGNGLSAFTPFEGIYISSGSICEWDNGYPSGGNYYSDLTVVDNFRGPSQNLAGPDGIIDTPLDLGGGNVDSYPLVSAPAI